MKIDVRQRKILNSDSAITIQSDYPFPLIAADSMSQSGMCIINQWLLFAPNPPSSTPLFALSYSQCKTVLRTFPSSATKSTAQSLQDDVRFVIDETSLTSNEHTKGSN